jgi:hypothetical protein
MAGDKLHSVSDSVADGLVLASDTLLEIADLIPGVGKALELARIYRSTSNALFARKIARFLAVFSDLPTEKRTAFFAKLRDDDALERFGETTLLILAQSDEIEKPIVIGRLFRAAALDLVSIQVAIRLSAIVNRAFFEDLTTLADFERPSKTNEPDVAVSLRALGLLKITEQDVFDAEASTYALSTYGKQLLRFGMRAEI